MNSQINYLAAKPRTGDRMQWPGERTVLAQPP
jgi:hypothetical protein